MGGFVTGAYDDQEAGDQEVTDEFFDETDRTSEVTDQPADINLAGDIYTPAAIEEMLGDWGAEQLSPPQHMPPPDMAAMAGQSASSVSSELLINISDRYEGEKSAQETGRKTPVEVRLAAQITFMQEQLDAALSQVTILEQKVNSQRDFVVTQVAWNTSMSEEAEQISKRLAEETGQLSSRIIATDAKAEAAHTAAKLADNRAKQATEVAAKSLQASVSHQKRLKELEANMAQISNTQETLHQQLTQQADKGAPTPLTAPMAETYENSIFFGGIPAFRDRLGLSPHSDPIFVMSRLLRDMGIYAGMDSIVLADNAAKSRLEVRAAIIHMRSSFHKRAAMVILRRELASQRLPGTTVRDCFPTIMMARVKRLNRLGMELKTAGKIVKFQVINRKGQPVLQTGLRNQNYADYQGTIEDEDEENNGEWILVENRRKRPHPENTLTSPNSRPLAADRQVNSQPPPTAATWAALTEQEFPELPSQAKPAESQHPETAKSAAKPTAAQRGAQPDPVDQQKKKQPGGGPANSRGPQQQPSRGPVGPPRGGQQQQPSRGPVEAPRGGQQQQPSRGPVETPRGSQPGSYPASRAGSQQNSRPSTPPPIRSIFDDDRSDNRNGRKSLLQRQFSSKFAQHLQHSRNEY
jgi:chemotaxis protein histidine kinase CheA